jgi:hypothetical protein
MADYVTVIRHTGCALSFTPACNDNARSWASGADRVGYEYALPIRPMGYTR